jgi:GIY-YIG catalytic domain
LVSDLGAPRRRGLRSWASPGKTEPQGGQFIGTHPKKPVKRTVMHYVYVLKSQIADKIYIGETADFPTERLSEHNAGSNTYSKRGAAN